jgi:hypothetical protein
MGPMTVPGFAADALDENGLPVWVSGLASENFNHTLHVVRGLDPAAALLALGARAPMIQPCTLAAERPDEWTSLARASIAPTDSGAVLLAGRVGKWTFVYDDAGMTGDDSAAILSKDGREAASTTETINADVSLTYAVDGQVFVSTGDSVELGSEIPDGLGPAIEAAGIFERDYLDEGEPDGSVNTRVVCLLAGLTGTLDDLRQIPLLAAPFS